MTSPGFRTLLLGSIAGVLVASAGGALAAEKTHVTAEALTGYQETPGVSTSGSGTFAAEIDEDATTITFVLTYTDLTGDAAVAHIHFGNRFTAGGVSAFFCGGGGKPACPAGTSGTVSGVITPADIIGPVSQGITAGEFGELVRAVRAGLTYANVHTALFPSGEIRGQINDRDQRQPQ
jgi:hypothetical protein